MSVANGSHCQATMIMTESKRHSGKPVERLETHRLEQESEETVHGVHEHVLPHERRHCRHHEERRDHQDANDPLPEDVLIEQQRKGDAADHGDQQNAADDQKSIDQRIKEGWVGQEELVVQEAHELVLAGHQQIVVQQ